MLTNKDCRGKARGKCHSCDDCEEFLSEKGSFLCGYCSCAPAKHELEPAMPSVSSMIQGRERMSPKLDESAKDTIDLIEVEKESENKTDAASSSSEFDNSESIKYYEKSLEKIYENKIAPNGIFELKRVASGKVQILCKPCSFKKERYIEPGPPTKAMSNLKAHIKTPSHQQYTHAFLKSPPKAVPSVTTEDLPKSRYKEIEDKFPGRFELLKISQGASTAKCRCTYCNQLISLLPDRGSFNANFDNHMKSCLCSQKRKRAQQTSLESFIVPTKKAKQQ
eukprot:Seg613.5 transcript_id=Seg613.5/GoldUCD/mRNA.D3Y31 product="hypothetical protein" protein_id=Seg613.5/GoldUCD/D3Y31